MSEIRRLPQPPASVVSTTAYNKAAFTDGEGDLSQVSCMKPGCVSLSRRKSRTRFVSVIHRILSNISPSRHFSFPALAPLSARCPSHASTASTTLSPTPPAQCFRKRTWRGDSEITSMRSAAFAQPQQLLLKHGDSI